jgi:hypothetical protein
MGGCIVQMERCLRGLASHADVREVGHEGMGLPLKMAGGVVAAGETVNEADQPAKPKR